MIDTALLARNKLDIGILTHVELRRGWALSEIKKHRIYRGEADSFEDYISGPPDWSPDAKKCMALYEFYIIKHKLHSEDIEDMHYMRLLEAMKAIKKQPNSLEEWLDACAVLSTKDLINETREARGKSQMPIQKATSSPGSPCILHPERKAEQAHWPITKKMGGKFTLPLCHECHMGYLHTKGDGTFYMKYKHKIMEYLATFQTAGR